MKTYLSLLCEAVDSAEISNLRKTLAKKSLRRIAMNPKIRKKCNYIGNSKIRNISEFEADNHQLRLLYGFSWSYTYKKREYDRRAGLRWASIFKKIDPYQVTITVW